MVFSKCYMKVYDWQIDYYLTQLKSKMEGLFKMLYICLFFVVAHSLGISLTSKV